MNSLLIINNCIVLLHIICILVNLTTAAGPVGSSCRYSGNFDPKDKICDKDPVKLHTLPYECSSFVYDGVVCNKDHVIVYRRMPEDLDNLGKLIEFNDRRTNVFLFYTHGSLEDWSDALYSGDYAAEAQIVNEFLGTFPVKGLILDDIYNPILSDCNDFYKNFTAYVTAIKTKNPDLEIGLYLSARTFVESENQKINLTWYDFPKINGIIDFYLIEFATFNKCSDKLLHVGITPLASSDPGVMTLNQFATAFEQSCIDKGKVYFEFLISPQPRPEEIPNFNPCELSYNEYCKHEDWHQKMCIDNQDILYKKGEFAQMYSKGFVARDIDLVDRNVNCKCDDKFITFTMILNGYMNRKSPKTCDAFNRH